MLHVDGSSRDRSYGQHGLTVADRLNEQMSRRPIRRVVRRYRDGELLDLGCGYDARLLRHLLPWIRRGVGVDLKVSDSAKGVPNLSFHEQSVELALAGMPDAAFDLVTMCSILEHLRAPEAPLADCHRVLRPGGALMINVPTWWAKPVLEFMAFGIAVSPASEIDDHRMYYSKRDLWPLLVRAGFRPRLIRMKYHKVGMCVFAVARREGAGSAA